MNNINDIKNKLIDASKLILSLARELDELQQKNHFTNDLKQIATSVEEIKRLVGPFAVPMPDENMLIQTLHGTKYLIDPHDLIMAPQLIIYRQWEPDLSEYFLSHFTSNTVFVDVGANFGYFTCLAGSRIGQSGNGRVIAVEPNPRLFQLLQMNCSINWSMCPIDLHQKAIAVSDGILDLWIPENRAANASLSAAAGGKPHKVDVRSLDSILDIELKIDLLKIDVEGHERGVLLGAKEVIKRSPNINIVIEWSVSQMLQAGISPIEMIKTFEELNLCPMHLPANKDSHVVPFNKSDLLATEYANLLLIHS
jgi:FkbM family methyltransferase